MPTLTDFIPDRKQLTFIEHKFFKHLLNGASPTDAAVLAFNTSTRLSASVRASQTLKKFSINLPQLMEHMGLTDEKDVQDLLRLRKAKKTTFFPHYKKDENGKEVRVMEIRKTDDNTVQTRVLELTMKLKGYLDDAPKVNVENNFTVIQHMREALREREERNKVNQSKQ